MIHAFMMLCHLAPNLFSFEIRQLLISSTPRNREPRSGIGGPFPCFPSSPPHLYDPIFCMTPPFCIKERCGSFFYFGYLYPLHWPPKFEQSKGGYGGHSDMPSEVVCLHRQLLHLPWLCSPLNIEPLTLYHVYLTNGVVFQRISLQNSNLLHVLSSIEQRQCVRIGWPNRVVIRFQDSLHFHFPLKIEQQEDGRRNMPIRALYFSHLRY